MNVFKQPGFLLRLAIAIGYICLGVLLFFNYKEMDILNKKWSVALAALLLVYGAFRVFRAVQLLIDDEA